MKTIKILLLSLMTGAAYSAQLAEVEMSKGVSWVGYFDENSRIIAVIKPKSVVVLPQNIEPTKIEKVKDETPQLQLMRGECLRRFGEALIKDGESAKQLERKKLQKEKGQEAIDEAEIIIKNANQLLELIKLTKAENSVEEKDDKSNLGQEWVKAIDSLKKLAKDRVDADKKLHDLVQVEMVQRENLKKMLKEWFFKKADLNEVKVTVNAGEAGSAQKVQEVENLNNWIRQISTMKSQGNIDRNNGNIFYGDQIRSYAKVKKQEWLVDVINAIEDTGRN